MRDQNQRPLLLGESHGGAAFDLLGNELSCLRAVRRFTAADCFWRVNLINVKSSFSVSPSGSVKTLAFPCDAPVKWSSGVESC